MTTSMAKVIHFTRHAQAEHNVDEDYFIPDAPLTPLGRRQAEELYSQTTELQQSADLLVTSPLKRTLQTTIIGYRGLRARLESQNSPKPIVVLSRLQEVNDFPCDTGSSRYELEQNDEFAGIDFESLEDDWNSKQGDSGAVKARARWVRRWLRDRPEQNIVVVAHGDILRQITKTSLYEASPWANVEVRKFTFMHDSDDEAKLVALPAETEARAGGEEPTSSEFKFNHWS
ncbi:histidine phosphatase superfamily [Lentinula aff. lateritia]|uniref:Histidine phosphatase superfamily n=1 Tax=Lentinula aff. lateritia TaxID=2804960 RepID=A0ACC1TTZ8_9AGAR|nr:histidine phosphatase superfamily [Lentinula aff. lateritia]